MMFPARLTPVSFPWAFRHGLVVAVMAGSTLLGGCAPLLVGGAIVGGSLVVTDRRTSGAQVDDQTIELKASNRMTELIGDKGHVNVTSYNRSVLLTGEVPAETDKAAVEQAVARLGNVKTIFNELTVGPPSSLSDRSRDTLLTSKVKASMVDAKDIQAQTFKVVTERSVVYLMGRVTEREANRAAEISRGVSGVSKVVTAFDVVSEAELVQGQAKSGTKP